VPGGEHIERACGIIFAVDSDVPLEELGEELIAAERPPRRQIDGPDLWLSPQRDRSATTRSSSGSNEQPGISCRRRKMRARASRCRLRDDDDFRDGVENIQSNDRMQSSGI